MLQNIGALSAKLFERYPYNTYQRLIVYLDAILLGKLVKGRLFENSRAWLRH